MCLRGFLRGLPYVLRGKIGTDCTETVPREHLIGASKPAAELQALIHMVGPHGLEPWTKGL
ncbi:hypothetical protein EMIT0P253_270053 [Pseudomonas sp. IT-P253]